MIPALDSPAPTARVSVLTPQGRGAIAVLRLWGPDAVEVADRAFRPGGGVSLAKSVTGRLRVGRIGDDLGDEVVTVIVTDGGDPEVEIQCHGGSAAVTLVLDALVAEGAEVRQPVAWIRESAPSAFSAEANVDLMRAQTVRSAEILLEQSQGALENDIHRCIQTIDNDVLTCQQIVDALLQRSELGLRLISGWRVVLAGRPNVGKSRLLNALAGYARAIVAPTPGTTRDVVTVRTALDGWPVELADTAGLRESADLIEASGVALARTRQQDADLVLLILDGSEPLTESDRVLLDTQAHALVVVNKCDLTPAWAFSPSEVQVVSAERGDGIEALGLAIARRLVPSSPPPGAGVPFRPAHVRRLQRAAEAIREKKLQAARRSLEEHLVPLADRSSGSGPTR